VCHDERVIDAFADGILWVTLGQTPQLLAELTKLYAAVTGERPGFVDVDDAVRELALRLEHRSCLLVIDDAWSGSHVAPYLVGFTQGRGVLHPNQFQVNEAWIAFKLNGDPIHTEHDGDFNFFALMDAASCFLLGSTSKSSVSRKTNFFSSSSTRRKDSENASVEAVTRVHSGINTPWCPCRP